MQIQDEISICCSSLLCHYDLFFMIDCNRENLCLGVANLGHYALHLNIPTGLYLVSSLALYKCVCFAVLLNIHVSSAFFALLCADNRSHFL